MNKYGLSRHIPDEIKRIIRQNSKFGCVVPTCRNAFYTYEHLIPEYKDAQIHDPDKICLTCPSHNPRREGPEGQANYSKQQLIKYYEALKSNPNCLNIKNNDFFSGFEKSVKIIIGSSSFKNIESIINVDGENVLSFSYNQTPESFEPQVKFSGTFKKPNGDLLFVIKNNEWHSPSTHWDVETSNGRISIFDSEKKIIFKAEKFPKQNSIKITELNLWYKPFHIFIKDNELLVGRVEENEEKGLYITLNAVIEHSKCALYLNSKDLYKPLDFYGFEIHGNKGAELIDNGIYIGKGGGVMHILSIGLNSFGHIIDRVTTKLKESNVPTDGNYFVKGILEEKIIQYPLWIESEYWLNGQKLDTKPSSWGKLNDKGENLYYISRDEKVDLSLNKGFLGFYADDLLNTEYQDWVFEMVVEEIDEEGNILHNRIKRKDLKNRKVISEFDAETKRYFHPHQFAGISPWKHKGD